MEDEDIVMNIALLSKEGKLALVAMAGNTVDSAVLKQNFVDEPVIKHFRNFFKAVQTFEGCIESGKKNGWTLFHLGKPNYG